MSKKRLIFFHFELKTFVICLRRNDRAESANAEPYRRRIFPAPKRLGTESSQRRISRAETAVPKSRRPMIIPSSNQFQHGNMGYTKNWYNLVYGNCYRIDYPYGHYYRIAIRYPNLRSLSSYRVYDIYDKVQYRFWLPYSNLFGNYPLYWQINDRETKFKRFPTIQQHIRRIIHSENT